MLRLEKYIFTSVVWIDLLSILKVQILSCEPRKFFFILILKRIAYDAFSNSKLFEHKYLYN